MKMIRLSVLVLLLALCSISSALKSSTSINRAFGRKFISSSSHHQYQQEIQRSQSNLAVHVSLSADPYKTSSRSRRTSSSTSTSTLERPSIAPPAMKEQIQELSQIDLLYDSKCPICMMEVEFLKKRDIHNKIRFTDLQSADYNPAEHGNVQFSEGMRKIRAVLPDKTVVMGVEVFRQTYEAIGLGWIFSLTKLPVIGYLADRVYDIWAENRLRLTGREELAEELKERAETLRQFEFDECDTDACGIDYDEL